MSINEDILRHSFSFCSVKELGRLSRVNKEWRECVDTRPYFSQIHEAWHKGKRLRNVTVKKENGIPFALNKEWFVHVKSDFVHEHTMEIKRLSTQQSQQFSCPAYVSNLLIRNNYALIFTNNGRFYCKPLSLLQDDLSFGGSGHEIDRSHGFDGERGLLANFSLDCNRLEIYQLPSGQPATIQIPDELRLTNMGTVIHGPHVSFMVTDARHGYLGTFSLETRRQIRPTITVNHGVCGFDGNRERLCMISPNRLFIWDAHTLEFIAEDIPIRVTWKLFIDEKLIKITSDDHYLQLFDIQTGRFIKEMPLNYDVIDFHGQSCAFAKGKQLRVLDLNSGEIFFEHTANSTIDSISLQEDGEEVILAYNERGGQISFWHPIAGGKK